tara:strand:- start:12547 stop:12858 length:312 start_codon:yes stop_codon:yes gene_type:complete
MNKMKMTFNQPIKLRGSQEEIKKYIQELKTKNATLANENSVIKMDNEHLTKENKELRSKIASMTRDTEKRVLENFKKKTAEKRLKAELMRKSLGGDYETDEDE